MTGRRELLEPTFNGRPIRAELERSGLPRTGSSREGRSHRRTLAAGERVDRAPGRRGRRQAWASSSASAGRGAGGRGVLVDQPGEPGDRLELGIGTEVGDVRVVPSEDRRQPVE